MLRRSGCAPPRERSTPNDAPPLRGAASRAPDPRRAAGVDSPPMAIAAIQDFQLPDLRFVPVANVVPHEQSDSTRLTPLVERLKNEAVLHNPPIVTPLAASGADAARYVVLDGANRSAAAREAGFVHLLVQVVRYEEPDVRLRTWHHALAGVARDEFERACGAAPGLGCRKASLLDARALLARREILAYACYPGGGVTTFQGSHDLHERNTTLHAIVDVYREKHRFYRTATDSLEAALEHHPDVTALLVFPHFEPAEVLELATRGERLPAGITRHLVQGRALRLNVPIERMTDAQTSLADKNKWLERWLLDKLEARQIRSYEEPTVIFDE